jgi:sodium/bile acid cotransporter 7
MPVLAALCVGACLGSHPDTDRARLDHISTLYATYRVAFSSVPEIGADELKRELDAGADFLIVDVRPSSERDVATIPGAMSREELELRKPDPETRVVTVCTVGARSGRYARTLRRQSWDVANLEGGLLAWTHVRGPLVDASGEPTRSLHVYGKGWNLVANGYAGVVTDRSGDVTPLP